MRKEQGVCPHGGHSPEHIMKKWPLFFILGFLMLCATSLPGGASEEVGSDSQPALTVQSTQPAYPYINFTPKSANEPLKISGSITPKTFDGPGTAQVTLDITNVSDAPIEIIVIKAGDGSVIEQLSTLGSGDPTISRSLKADITQEQLDNGKVVFTIAWEQGESNGEKSIGLEIKPLQPKPQIEFERVASPKIAYPGQEVSVTYTVKNTGNIRLVDIKVTDDLLNGQPNQINGLKPNDKYSFTQKVIMGEKDIISKPQVVYALEDGTPLSKSLESLVISVAKPDLQVILKADKLNVTPGEQVNLIIELVNGGNVEYSKIVISEPKLSDKGDIQPLKAGKTYTYATPVTVDAPASYTFTVSALDSTKNKISVASNTINIGVDSDINVTIAAVPETDIIGTPGVVNFRVMLNNKGATQLGETVLSIDGIGDTHMLPVLPTGESVVDVPVDVEETRAFQFMATVTDLSGNKKSITASRVTVELAVSDEPEIAGIVANDVFGEEPPDDGGGLDPRSVQEQPQETASWLPSWLDIPSVIMIASIVLIALIVLCVVALLTVSFVERRKKNSSAADTGARARRGRVNRYDQDTDIDEADDFDDSDDSELDSDEYGADEYDSDEYDSDEYDSDDNDSDEYEQLNYNSGKRTDYTRPRDRNGIWGESNGTDIKEHYSDDMETKAIPVINKRIPGQAAHLREAISGGRRAAGAEQINVDDVNVVDPARRRSQRKGSR